MVIGDGMSESDALQQDQARLLYDALIEETKTIRAEILSIQDTQRKMAGVSIGVAGIVAPIVIAGFSAASLDIQALILVFIALAFAYQFIALAYVGLTRGILRLTHYQMSHLAPGINSIIGLEHPVAFQWEHFLRQDVRQPFWELIGFALYAVGEFMLIVIPSLASMTAAIFLASRHTGIAVWQWLSISLYAILLILIFVFALTTLLQSRRMPFGNEVRLKVDRSPQAPPAAVPSWMILLWASALALALLHALREDRRV